MKIIVPMAGRGSRLRPHTLTVPKPLVPIAGKSIVQRLVEDITQVCGQKVDEIAFVIGDFGDAVEAELLEIAKRLNAKGSIYHQDEALGTAHAILCAKESLEGPVVVAFADTLFRADFTLDTEKDGIIWVQKVEDPKAYGVIKMNESNVITDFIEKPQKFVSDLAIIGIYFFKDGLKLRNELQYLISNNITENGEFQLTNVLESMKQKGASFYPGKVVEWLDCGNPVAAVHANKRVLECTANDEVREALNIENSHIIEPCFIGANVQLKNCTIGPHVSIGNDSCVTNSTIKNTIIQNNTRITDADLEDSMIGNHVEYQGGKKRISIGDYSKIG
ncbi:MAG: sugar phosphate nucleotidyltransferase [Flavobacteriales bacterium]|nr:sugar phosphate nucleotidyltransferase [Flavobacteriales bacterium]